MADSQKEYDPILTENLTLNELIEIEEISGYKYHRIVEILNEGAVVYEGGLLKALVFLVNRMTDKDYTMDDAGNTPISEIAAQITQ